MLCLILFSRLSLVTGWAINAPSEHVEFRSLSFNQKFLRLIYVATGDIASLFARLSNNFFGNA